MVMMMILWNFCKQETVEVLLRHQADVNARDKNWQTPLHVAAANNAVKCAEFIIPCLTNVNVSDRSGRTSLHHAAFNGHLEVVSSRTLPYSIFKQLWKILLIITNTICSFWMRAEKCCGYIKFLQFVDCSCMLSNALIGWCYWCIMSIW